MTHQTRLEQDPEVPGIINNLLFHSEHLLHTLAKAEQKQMLVHKMKYFTNSLVKEVRKHFFRVFDVSNEENEAYDDMFHWLSSQVAVFNEIEKLSESEKIKFLSAYENFITTNLRIK